ncbi:MAG TPA: hypothetical protein VGI10_14075 [Polyangiaceae bacterium]|jgi:hypothetical protein
MRAFDVAKGVHVMYIHHVDRLVRKQVYITEEQERLLKKAARQEQRSEAEILRAALDQAFRPKKVTHARGKRDPLWEVVGVGRTKRGNVARNVDRYLYGPDRS